jgi:hypothetical protein
MEHATVTTKCPECLHYTTGIADEYPEHCKECGLYFSARTLLAKGASSFRDMRDPEPEAGVPGYRQSDKENCNNYRKGD